MFQRSKLFSRDANNFIVNNWNTNINSIQVGVRPVKLGIKILLNLTTFTKIQETLSKMTIDDLLHTFIIFNFDNGESYTIERDKRVEIKPAYKTLTTETELTPEIPVNIILGEFYTNWENYVGGFDNIFYYDAITNNCQTFILEGLDSNGLLSNDILNFFKQDTETILSGFPSTSGLINKLAGFVSDIDVYLFGQGLK